MSSDVSPETTTSVIDVRHVRVIVAVAVIAFMACIAVSAPQAAPLTQAPELVLHDVKGAAYKIDYHAGKLTLVNIWAVWCGPCREEMPHIARMSEAYGKQGFQAIGIAVQSGQAADVKAFLDENKDFGIKYPILVGNDVVLERFGDVQVVPTTFLVDPSGKVVRRFLGVTPGFALKLEDEIKKALHPPQPRDETKKP